MLRTSDHLELSARLTIPSGQIHGAVVIIQGGGNVSFDGDVSCSFLGEGYRGAQPLLSRQIAHRLADAGIASLRYSKRGVEDPALLPLQTIPFLEKDVIAAFELVRFLFPTLPTGYVGFSEGALLGTLAALKTTPSALFLLAPVTRSYKDVLRYQFIDWPIQVLLSATDKMKPGSVPASWPRNQGITRLPVSEEDYLSFGLGSDGQISVESLKRHYEDHLSTLLLAIQGSPLEAWMQSVLETPAFSSIAPRISAPTYVYQALEDTQLDPRWVQQDASLFHHLKAIRLYEGLGHCFSPLEGVLREKKTSGPLHEDLLVQLTKDISNEFTGNEW